MMKSSKHYILHALLLFGVLILMSYIDFQIREIASRDDRLWEWIVIRMFLYIPVGLVLALPSFIQNFKKAGNWKIDYKKLIIIGIPALYFTIYFLIHHSLPINILNVQWFIVNVRELNTVGGVILGYIILTSFNKIEK